MSSLPSVADRNAGIERPMKDEYWIDTLPFAGNAENHE